MWIMV